MILQSTLLGRNMYALVCLTDLENDFINPYDLSSKMNRFVVHELAAQGALAALLVLSGNWLAGGAHAALLAYMLRLHAGRGLTVDTTDAFRQLPQQKRQRFVLLSAHLALFVLVVFRLIETALLTLLTPEGRAMTKKLLHEAAASGAAPCPGSQRRRRHLAAAAAAAAARMSSTLITASTVPADTPWGPAGAVLLCLAPIAFLLAVTLVPRIALPSRVSLPVTAGLMACVTLGYLRTPPLTTLAALASGVLEASIPLSVVFGAILLFRTMEQTKCMPWMMAHTKRLSAGNPVAEVMLIGWAFACMLEGIGGFGAPVALAAPMLASLGHDPLLCVVSLVVLNSAASHLGSVGMVVWFGFGRLGLSPGNILLIGAKASVMVGAAALVVVPFAAAFLAPWRELARSWVFVLASILSAVAPTLVVSIYSQDMPVVVGAPTGTANRARGGGAATRPDRRTPRALTPGRARGRAAGGAVSTLVTGAMIYWGVGIKPPLCDATGSLARAATLNAAAQDAIDALEAAAAAAAAEEAEAQRALDAAAAEVGKARGAAARGGAACDGDADSSDADGPAVRRRSRVRVLLADAVAVLPGRASAAPAASAASGDCAAASRRCDASGAGSPGAGGAPAPVLLACVAGAGGAAAGGPLPARGPGATSARSAGKLPPAPGAARQSARSAGKLSPAPSAARQASAVLELPPFSAREAVLRTLPIWLTVLTLLLTRVGPVHAAVTARRPAFTVRAGTLADVSVSAALVLQVGSIFTTSASATYEALFVPCLLPFVLASAVTLLVHRADLGAATSWRTPFREAWARMVGTIAAMAGALALAEAMRAGGAASPGFILGYYFSAWLGKGYVAVAGLLGALSSFVGGSVMAGNLMLGSVQLVAAARVGLPLTAMLALQDTGCCAGKMVCVANVLACKAVMGLGHVREGVIITRTLLPAALLLAVATPLSLLFMLPLPGGALAWPDLPQPPAGGSAA
ncbi:L-lactate permease [Scenedesmus sp. PABB004]|nr:L-lactate permease [Scenedesmus sp. PABB004]